MTNAANTPGRNDADLLARRDAVFGNGSPLFYDTPVHLVRGEGAWLWDTAGNRYLDLYNNIPVVGHCNPRVTEAMAAQAARHTTHSRYLDATIVDYAERLLNLHHRAVERIVFACTGTEANDIAMQMARLATGGEGFLCTDATYHGNSALVSTLTRAPHRGRPGVHSFPFPQTYRPLREGATEAELCELHLEAVQSAIDDFAASGTGLAGMILCSILANEGLPDVPSGFLPRAAELVRRAGGLVIMDEVQAGFCRTGRWWGYDVMGVEPDIVTMGKPMGNGLPMAACAARADLVNLFRKRTRYFNTFAATPVHGAVGAAVLDELERMDATAHVTAMGERLMEGLHRVTAGSPHVGDVRGTGLFAGIEWVTDRESKAPDWKGAARMANALKERGVLLSNAGAFGNVLKVRPPLVIDADQIDLFLGVLEETLDDPRVEGAGG